jgi:hypothetical protein
MSDAGNFLARWSRRKREAAQQPATSEPPSGAERPQAPDRPAVEDAAPPAPLPPLESIDATTDLKPFLAPGVSADLVRAALRRAWAADPAIRDFVGLAENAWDFTAPDGVPGFGSLTQDEVQRLIAELERAADSTEPPSAPSAAADAAAEPEEHPTPAADDAAMQQGQARVQSASLQPNRRHGGALPK